MSYIYFYLNLSTKYTIQDTKNYKRAWTTQFCIDYLFYSKGTKQTQNIRLFTSVSYTHLDVYKRQVYNNKPL